MYLIGVIACWVGLGAVEDILGMMTDSCCLVRPVGLRCSDVENEPEGEDICE